MDLQVYAGRIRRVEAAQALGQRRERKDPQRCEGAHHPIAVGKARRAGHGVLRTSRGAGNPQGRGSFLLEPLPVPEDSGARGSETEEGAGKKEIGLRKGQRHVAGGHLLLVPSSRWAKERCRYSSSPFSTTRQGSFPTPCTPSKGFDHPCWKTPEEVRFGVQELPACGLRDPGRRVDAGTCTLPGLDE